MQREDVLGQALQLLEIQGIASTTLEMVADRIDYPLDELKRFWPDKEALLYDALRYRLQNVPGNVRLGRYPKKCSAENDPA